LSNQDGLIEILSNDIDFQIEHILDKLDCRFYAMGFEIVIRETNDIVNEPMLEKRKEKSEFLINICKRRSKYLRTIQKEVRE